MRIPVLGEVAAGRPVEFLPIVAWRHIRPIRGTRLNDSFAAARVIGDSLIDDGIFDGDYVICLLTHEAPDGALVVALTPEGLTVKYLSRQPDGTVLLRGANPDYPNQIWNGEDVLVQGVVKRIERDL
jgi:repressor LexA